MKLDTENFIKKAIKKHGNKYDYSKVVYDNYTTPVSIICPKHGEFQQVPSDHLAGCGCPECYAERRGNATRKGNDAFIAQAREIHGDKYDYSKVEYKNAYTPVTIICPIHGEFQQVPHNHGRGQGCPKCRSRRISTSKMKTTEMFIQQAQEVHKGENYDYSQVEYKGTHVPVHLTCPNGHEIDVRPVDFLHGHGCRICNSRLHITENDLYDKLKTLYPDAIHSYRPSWLHGKTSSQELDIFIPSLKLGIEYQGSQHFISRNFCDGDEGLVKTKERDLRKYNKCKENGITLLYVSYEKEVPQDYISTIYTDYESLLSAIENIKKTE